MKQLRLKTILFIILTISFASCNNTDNDEPELPKEVTINGDQPVIASKGGVSELSFSSSEDWTIEIETTVANTNWCTVTPTSGKAGTTIVQIWTKENENYSDRTAYLKIKTSKTKSVLVTQKKKDAILVSKDKYEVNTAGGEITVEVNANTTYQVVVPSWCEDWIKHKTNKLRSLTKSTETFLIEKGSTQANREGQIIFINGTLADTVYVFQAMRNSLVLTANQVNLTEEAQFFDVELLANISYQVTIPDTLTWIKIAPARSLKVDKVSFSADQNTTASNRTGQIIFRNAELNIADTLTVKQIQKGALILSNKAMKVISEPSTIEVELRANIEYEIIIPNAHQSWITQGTKKELNTIQQSFVIAQNTTSEVRQGTIYFKDKKTNFQDFVTIEQEKSKSEKDILIEFYNALDGNKWTQKTNWGSSKPLGEWYGITTNNQGKVTEISLINNNLLGEIPDGIFSLEKLDFINFNQNKINAIPASIKNATNLAFLFLEATDIEIVPPQIGQLSKLQLLDLSATKLTHPLPSEFVNLQNLQDLYIRNCLFAGDSATSTKTIEMIANLANLIVLDLLGCDLTGSIPTSISKLKKLVYLNLTANKFSGKIPPSIVEMSALRQVFLGENNLTGNIPNGFDKMINLYVPAGYKTMDFSGNRLSGVIPEDFTLNPHFDTWNVEAYVLPQQKGYFLTLPGQIKYQSTDYSKDGEVLILQKSSVGKGIDLVFMGDGFVDRDMATDGKYEQIMKRAMEHYFSIEPNTSYRNYFNVYAIKAVSKHEIYDGNSSSIFEVEFGEGTHIGGNDKKCVEYANKAPLRNIYDTQLSIVVNSKRDAGTCYMYYSGTAIGYVPLHSTDDEFRRILLHESAGHGFAKLADEYTKKGTTAPTDEKWTVDFNNMYKTYGWHSNVDITNNASLIRWKHFFQHPTYSSYTKIHQGAYLFERGVWRPEENSCMRYNDLYFNAPSREAIVKRIKKIAGETYSFDDFVAKDRYEPETNRNRLKVAKEYQHTPPVVINGPFRGAPKNR